MDYKDKYIKYKTKYIKLKSIIDNTNSINMSGGNYNKQNVSSHKELQTNKQNNIIPNYTACSFCCSFSNYDSITNYLG
jgi:hypothetical protein